MIVAVMGATGYGGQVLMRLLMDHPAVEKVLPVSFSAVGSAVDQRDRGLGPDPQKKLPEERTLLSAEEALARKPDAVFAALPHGASAEVTAPFLGQSVVLDLSADYRLNDATVHKAAYGQDAPQAQWRSKAVYGLTERYESALKSADLIAVPGCYPTCTLLPLLPLAEAGMLGDSVTVNALSGISGAGRSAKESSLFVERSENSVAYNPGLRHRHQPEMTQEIRKVGSSTGLFFTPHLVPMRRGMACTITFEPASQMQKLTASELSQRIGNLLNAAYGDRPFIGLRGSAIPATGDVLGSNRCDIGWSVEKNPENDGRMVYLFSVLDNLVKGAAGQAVQDFNIRFGFDEIAGLPLRAHV